MWRQAKQALKVQVALLVMQPAIHVEACWVTERPLSWQAELRHILWHNSFVSRVRHPSVTKRATS
jgi:hypothetical protein